jgi:hypothetical protein
MASKPSGKLLTFYIGTIAGVVALFGVVTAYGEKKLVAPPNIAGHYRVKAANLPPCLRDRDLHLQQSGAYLTASFTGNAAKPSAQLTGQLQPSNRFEMNLHRLPCNNGEPPAALALQGKLVSNPAPTNQAAKQLTGVIKYRSMDLPFEAVQTR